MNRIKICLLICIALSACTSSETDLHSTYKHVDYQFDRATTFNTFETKQFLSIDDTSDELIFGSINQIQRLSDGSLVAFDPNLITIHHFDSLGNVLHRIGREGSGPGEFSREANIISDGNRLYVFERMAMKIEVFEYQLQGWTHLQTIPIEHAGDDVPDRLLKAIGDSFWLIYRHFYQGENGARLARNHITRVTKSPEDSNVKYETWLAELPQVELIFEDMGGFIATYPKPYGARVVSAISSDGHILVGKTDRFRFSRVIPEADSIVTIQMEVPNIALSDPEKENMSGYAERIHKLVRDHMPDVRPATIPSIVPDDKNGFWAGYESKDEEMRRWLYVDENSQIRKEIRLPFNFRPQVSVSDTMYGIKSNADGSQSIIGYVLYLD